MRNEVTVAMGHSMGGHWFWLDHLSPEALRPIWIVLGLRTVYSERPGQPKHGTFSVHCDKHTDGFDGHGNSCDTLHRRWSLVLGHLSPEALRPIWIDLGGHWFWTASHPKPRYLFGSTSPLTATQAGIVNALWQSIACIAVQCGAPTLRSAITDSLQSSEVSSSG
ncbi:uncharacterized protein LOC142589915 isoform X5 [Dermacentor variabilis]|uniref:uncharacterized protein LOC142589915 isoform X5 n=1 Tax=Dermacentor variabilis TaxID=34621 RepID=UPI003F5BC65D